MIDYSKTLSDMSRLNHAMSYELSRAIPEGLRIGIEIMAARRGVVAMVEEPTGPDRPDHERVLVLFDTGEGEIDTEVFLSAYERMRTVVAGRSVATPIVLSGRVYCVLMFEYACDENGDGDLDGFFRCDSSDMSERRQLVELVAANMARPIGAAEAAETNRRKLQERRAIEELVRTALSDASRKTLNTRAWRALADNLGADRVGMYVYHEDAVNRCEIDRSNRDGDGLPKSMATGRDMFASWVLDCHRAVIFSPLGVGSATDTTGQDKYHKNVILPEELTGRHGVAVRIAGKDNLFGLLVAVCDGPRAFTADAADFMVRVAGIMAEALVRSQYEEALAESERRYRMMLDTAADFVLFVLDASGTITDASGGTRAVLGYDQSQLVGMNIASLMPSRGGVSLWKAHRDRVIEFGRFSEQQNMNRCDGTTIWVVCVVTAVRDDSGVLTGYTAIIRDRTERRRFEKAIQTSERKQRNLARSTKILLHELDHRVKNTLSGLIALLSIYQKSCETTEEFAESMRQKIMAIKTVHDLTTSQTPRSMNLRDLVTTLSKQLPNSEGVCGAVSEAHRRERVIDRFALDGPEVNIYADQVAPLAIMFQELFTNSWKYGALRADRGEGRVLLTWRRLEGLAAKPGGELVLEDDDASMEMKNGDAGRMGESGEAAEADVLGPLELVWQESGVGGIVKPAEFGVGLRLVEGFARYELHGSVEFTFEPPGFGCRIVCRTSTYASSVF